MATLGITFWFLYAIPTADREFRFAAKSLIKLHISSFLISKLAIRSYNIVYSIFCSIQSIHISILMPRIHRYVVLHAHIPLYATFDKYLPFVVFDGIVALFRSAKPINLISKSMPYRPISIKSLGPIFIKHVILSQINPAG